MLKYLRKLFQSEAEGLEDSLATMGLEFPDLRTAEKCFLEIREEKKQQLKHLIAELPQVDFSYRAESLKDLEMVYFDIYIDKKSDCSLSQNEFKENIDFYVQELFVKNKMAVRKVSENHFTANRYLDGLEFSDGAWSNSVYSEHIQPKNNKNRDSLFNYFMQFIPEELENEI